MRHGWVWPHRTFELFPVGLLVKFAFLRRLFLIGSWHRPHWGRRKCLFFLLPFLQFRIVPVYLSEPLTWHSLLPCTVLCPSFSWVGRRRTPLPSQRAIPRVQLPLCPMERGLLTNGLAHPTESLQVARGHSFGQIFLPGFFLVERKGPEPRFTWDDARRGIRNVSPVPSGKERGCLRGSRKWVHVRHGGGAIGDDDPLLQPPTTEPPKTP